MQNSSWNLPIRIALLAKADSEIIKILHEASLEGVRVHQIGSRLFLALRMQNMVDSLSLCLIALYSGMRRLLTIAILRCFPICCKERKNYGIRKFPFECQIKFSSGLGCIFICIKHSKDDFLRTFLIHGFMQRK